MFTLTKKDVEFNWTPSCVALFDKEVKDYAVNQCVSCNILFRRSAVTKVSFYDNLGKVWPYLKAHILKGDPKAEEKTLFMCRVCKEALKENKMPSKCVLNGLQVSEVPAELAKLNCLSRQLIQRTKAYQTVVRLGTYNNKVPVYHCLKACKGNIFFLPLLLEKTMATLEKVESPLEDSELDELVEQALPDPELYIMVNSHLSKTRVVWRDLVDVNDVKAAITKLKEINPFYKDVDDKSLDSSVR